MIVSYIRSIVTNLPGYTINDILDTDFDLLVEVTSKDDSKDKKEMSLFDFIKNT